MNIVLITLLYPDNKNQTLTQVPYTLHYFVKNWIAQGHTVQVIKIESIYPKYLPYYGKLSKQRRERDVAVDGVPIHVMQSKIEINIKYSKRYANHVGRLAVDYCKKNRIKCDAIIFHLFEPSFYIAKHLKEYYRVPMIFGVHMTDSVWAKQNNGRLLRKYAEDIDGFAFRSKALQTSFQKYLPTNKNGFVIYSGIPEACIKGPRQIDIEHKILRFITVSNFIKRKNIDLIIKAIYELVKSDNNIMLTIIGDGKERRHLERLVEKYKLERNISFLGHLKREEVFLKLDTHDVFILPSVDETFGMVYLEAMARNCIPIGTINQGIDGIIKDGINGFLVYPTLESVCEKMKKVIELSHAEKRDLHQRIAESISEYTEEECARRYIQHVDDIVKKN